MPKCKVSRQQLLKAVSSVKDDNLNIMGIGIRRRNFVDALKVINADVLEMSTGLISWNETTQGFGGIYQSGIANEPCLNVAVEHHVMRFLNRPVSMKPMCKVDLIDFSTMRDGIVPARADVEIDSLVFYEAVKRIAVYACKEESRPILTGIAMQFKPTRLVIVAADGFRLGQIDLPLREKIEFKPEAKHDYIINAFDLVKSVLPIAQMSTGKGKNKDYGYIGLTLKDNAITFAKDGRSATMSNIEGNFPKWEQLIPAGGTEVKFIASEMREAVGNLGKIAADSSNILRLEGEGESITLSAQSSDIGESQTQVSAKMEQPFKIAFNYEYLSSMLWQMPKDTIVKMSVTNPTCPGMFKWDGYTAVIMPMFVQWAEKSKESVPAMA